MDKNTIELMLREIEIVLDAAHQQQTKRAHAAARRIRPELTSEDMLNPDNFPEIITNPDFMYEDGQAAGILSAKMTVRARLKELLSVHGGQKNND